MKKSKIISLALGLTTLATTTIATTTILTSCSKKEEVSNEELKEGFVNIVMNQGEQKPADAGVIKEKGVNKFIVYTGIKDGKPAIGLNAINYENELSKGFTPDQIQKIGLNPAYSAFLLDGVDPEQKQKELDALKENESMVFAKDLYAVEFKNNGNNQNPEVNKSIKISFEIVVKFASFPQQN